MWKNEVILKMMVKKVEPNGNMVDYRGSIQKDNHVTFKYKEVHIFLVKSLWLYFSHTHREKD